MSSLTAENVEWLDSGFQSFPFTTFFFGLDVSYSINPSQYRHRSMGTHRTIPFMSRRRDGCEFRTDSHTSAVITLTLGRQQIWANPSSKSAPTIHFPPLDHPMARMTENTNLQRALLRRIDAFGKGRIEIREGSRVGEMKYGPGGRWVGLKIDDTWVRGGVVVCFLFTWVLRIDRSNSHF